jgi:hypothetical protein
MGGYSKAMGGYQGDDVDGRLTKMTGFCSSNQYRSQLSSTPPPKGQEQAKEDSFKNLVNKKANVDR